MEPKTIITILSIVLFIASITIIAQFIWCVNIENELEERNLKYVELHNEQCIAMLDLFRSEKVSVEFEKTVKKQSKRIAELIELCDKLQPDLVEKEMSIKDMIDAWRNFPHNEEDAKRKEYIASIGGINEVKEWGQRFENAKKFYKTTTGKDLELYNSQKQK